MVAKPEEVFPHGKQEMVLAGRVRSGGRQGSRALRHVLCGFFAGVTTLFVLLAIFGFSFMGIKPNALLDAVLFAGIAFGLSRYSRIAAVAGFALFVIEKIYMVMATGSFLAVGVLGILIALGFLNSIRRTFAHAKLGGAAPGGMAALLSGGRPAPSPGAKPLQM
jgi:hypothetical protein